MTKNVYADWIVALGNWEELGIKVVGTAAKWIQALELIVKKKQIF